MLLINLILRNDWEKSRLPQTVLPKYLSRIRAAGNEHLSCVQMAKLFNQGLGKWPRIKFKMVSFIESLNTSPGQALRYASQTCHSVPLWKVPTLKQQQSTGTHSETHAEPTLKSHSRFSRVLRNRSLLSFGRTGALCCSTSSTSHSAGLAASRWAGPDKRQHSSSSTWSFTDTTARKVSQHHALWQHCSMVSLTMQWKSERVLTTNHLLSFHHTSAALV